MKRVWIKFLEEVERDPKNWAKAMIDHLSPPKYAVEYLGKLMHFCWLCWKPRMDQCNICQRNICEEHLGKTFVGEKTKLEWYVCAGCVKTADLKEFGRRVKAEDERFWLEDQEEAESQ